MGERRQEGLEMQESERASVCISAKKEEFALTSQKRLPRLAAKAMGPRSLRAPWREQERERGRKE